MCTCFLILSFETEKSLFYKKPVRPLKFKLNQNCQSVQNNSQYEGVLWT